VSQALVVRTWTHTWAHWPVGFPSTWCDVGNDPCTGSVRPGDPCIRERAPDGRVYVVCAPCARTGAARLRQVAS
jgi:hypothetical protein